MGNYKFEISDWLPRFPLAPSYDGYSGTLVTSPCQLCNNLNLREEVLDQVDLGPGVPVDVFIMAAGEPPDRHVTKIGGLPYRPSGKKWPLTPAGLPMLFLAQFCFTDSKDLTGTLPGDVLLVFAPAIDEYPDPLIFEWYDLDLANLMDSTEMPERRLTYGPVHGHIFRTISYPDARRRPSCTDAKYLSCRGKEVWSEYWLFQYQATQIGRAPFYIQGDPRLPGRPLCAINSVCPDLHKPFPWINHPDPLFPEDDVGWEPDPFLQFGDTGCIYISCDDDGKLHSAMDCF